MQSQILSVHDRSKWQCLECVKACIIRLLIIADDHLLPKIEVFSALATFMVATQQEDLVRELDFEAEQVADDFWAVSASIYIVAEEKELFIVLTESLLAHYLAQVMKLAMNVAEHDDVAIDAHQIGISLAKLSHLLQNCHKRLFVKLAVSQHVVFCHFWIRFRGSLTIALNIEPFLSESLLDDTRHIVYLAIT